MTIILICDLLVQDFHVCTALSQLGLALNLALIGSGIGFSQNLTLRNLDVRISFEK